MGPPVISCCDSTPVLEFTEHILDLVPLAIQALVIVDLLQPVSLRWNTRLDASLFQVPPKPVGIIAFVDQQLGGLW